MLDVQFYVCLPDPCFIVFPLVNNSHQSLNVGETFSIMQYWLLFPKQNKFSCYAETLGRCAMFPSHYRLQSYLNIVIH